MDKTVKILEWIDVLEHRPLMILSDKTFLSLRAYVEGYVDGLGLAYDIPKWYIFISLWLRNKVGKTGNIPWINHIIYDNDKSEEELKIIVLQTLRRFFEENPEWYNPEKWIDAH
ncbi:hypothetical protein SAMN05428988_5230 [Chitinophaga sp. YR573]|uniref:hypothetical protein n=1 Tax=Chitinophaga sp. YR573 TaxID=1881040 RepID=UPI0008B9E435|nr:hypothetical protein [Chitinophaga sp. YR573]SEW40128.1 hypothetical protein SAMN05428988_5230 [Chitinophaga sp. YR573]